MLDLNTQFAIVFTIQLILMFSPLMLIAYVANKLVKYLRGDK